MYRFLTYHFASVLMLMSPAPPPCKTTPTCKIAIVLPIREGFSPQAFGAVSLSVRDFTLHSRYGRDSVVLGAVEAPPYDGIRYETLCLRRHWWETKTRAYARAIAARLDDLQPELIELHNRPVLVHALSGRTRVPLALHLHNDPQEMKAARTPRQRHALLKKCHAIYCISHWVRERFLEGLDAGHDKVHTIHSGIEILPPPEEKQNRIVYVGRMTPNKGAREFAQALASVLPRHPDWHGYMIGGRRHAVSDTLSPYEQEILHLMDTIGPNAHFEGFYPFEQTQAMFRSAAIVVIPSLWQEPFGRTGIEAIAQGCAVVTSGRGGLREIVGDSGIILDDISGETLAQAIERLIAHPIQRTAMQQAAYQRAMQFEISSCTYRLDDVRAAIISPLAHLNPHPMEACHAAQTH